MAKRCDTCGRGAVTGNARSHSRVASKRTFRVNLQSRRMDGLRQSVCTRCIKTRKKV